MKSEWTTVKLGEIVFEERLPVGTFDGNGLPVLGVTNVDGVTHTGVTASEDLSKYLRLKPGRFVYNPYRINVGSLGLSSETQDGITSPAYVVFVPRERIEAKYLHYFLKSARGSQLINFYGNRGTVRSALRFNDLCQIEIPLPPLAEQHCIVKRIEELAAQINEARTLRQQAAEEKEALIRSAARLKIESLDCEPTTLRECLDKSRDGIQTGPFGAQLRSDEFSDTGRPVLTIGNVQFNGLNTTNLMHVSEQKAAQLVRYRVCEGDILFARMGTVGRCCVVPISAHGWLINYHIIRVALDRNNIDPRFVHWTIQASPDIEQYLNDKIRGATRKGVNSKIVAGLPLRIPPLPEQRRIVVELDTLQAEVDAMKRLQAETAAEIDALLPSILDRAFKGEI